MLIEALERIAENDRLTVLEQKVAALTERLAQQEDMLDSLRSRISAADAAAYSTCDRRLAALEARLIPTTGSIPADLTASSVSLYPSNEHWDQHTDHVITAMQPSQDAEILE